MYRGDTINPPLKVRAGQFFFRGRVISKISPILQSGVELFPKISQMLIRGRVISRFQKILSIRAIVFGPFFRCFSFKTTRSTLTFFGALRARFRPPPSITADHQIRNSNFCQNAISFFFFFRKRPKKLDRI